MKQIEVYLPVLQAEALHYLLEKIMETIDYPQMVTINDLVKDLKDDYSQYHQAFLEIDDLLKGHGIV